MRLNSKRKGKRLERALAKIFSDWFGVPGSFQRTPDSGAHETRKAMAGQDDGWMSGDVYGPRDCILHIESKNCEGWALEQLLNPKARQPIATFWRQACRDCPDWKRPLLVFSRNFYPELVLYRYSDFETVADPDCYFLLRGVSSPISKVEREDGVTRDGRPDSSDVFVITTLESFLRVLDPKSCMISSVTSGGGDV